MTGVFCLKIENKNIRFVHRKNILLGIEKTFFFSCSICSAGAFSLFLNYEIDGDDDDDDETILQCYLLFNINDF